MNRRIFILLLLLIVIAGLAVAVAVLDETSGKGDPGIQPIATLHCAIGGGRWRTLKDGCGDSCVSKQSYANELDRIACAMSLTDGCDCGPDRCWGGNRCVANPQ